MCGMHMYVKWTFEFWIKDGTFEWYTEVLSSKKKKKKKNYLTLY